jgi:hypothetical protein
MFRWRRPMVNEVGQHASSRPSNRLREVLCTNLLRRFRL